MSNDYDVDFARWADEQVGLLRAKELDALDIEHLAEEIEGLAGRDRRELRNRLKVLLTHLLKWQRQYEHRSVSWSSTIREQRHQIEAILEDSPSMRRLVDEYVIREWDHAADRAADETRIERHNFPETCPWSSEQVLDVDFLPE